MSEYLVKVGFWLRAYDSVTIEAASDVEAIEKAKIVAVTAIDTDERRQGVIAYVDRLSCGTREAVAEDVAFDTDRIDVPC